MGPNPDIEEGGSISNAAFHCAQKSRVETTSNSWKCNGVVIQIGIPSLKFRHDLVCAIKKDFTTTWKHSFFMSKDQKDSWLTLCDVWFCYCPLKMLVKFKDLPWKHDFASIFSVQKHWNIWNISIPSSIQWCTLPLSEHDCAWCSECWVWHKLFLGKQNSVFPAVIKLSVVPNSFCAVPKLIALEIWKKSWS